MTVCDPGCIRLGLSSTHLNLPQDYHFLNKKAVFVVPRINASLICLKKTYFPSPPQPTFNLNICMLLLVKQLHRNSFTKALAQNAKLRNHFLS